MRRRLLAGAAAAVLTALAGTGVDAVAGAGTRTVLGPGVVTVEIGIEHSRFDVDRVDVRAGTVVRFVVHNRDPILHELVVGHGDVHDRHERGREQTHPPVPGEVSLGAGETGLTVYEFDEAGTFTFACHLPGHLAYGMAGEVVVHA